MIALMRLPRGRRRRAETIPPCLSASTTMGTTKTMGFSSSDDDHDDDTGFEKSVEKSVHRGSDDVQNMDGSSLHRGSDISWKALLPPPDVDVPNENDSIRRHAFGERLNSGGSSKASTVRSYRIDGSYAISYVVWPESSDGKVPAIEQPPPPIRHAGTVWGESYERALAAFRAKDFAGALYMFDQALTAWREGCTHEKAPNKIYRNASAYIMQCQRHLCNIAAGKEQHWDPAVRSLARFLASTGGQVDESGAPAAVLTLEDANAYAARLARWGVRSLPALLSMRPPQVHEAIVSAEVLSPHRTLLAQHIRDHSPRMAWRRVRHDYISSPALAHLCSMCSASALAAGGCTTARSCWSRRGSASTRSPGFARRGTAERRWRPPSVERQRAAAAVPVRAVRAVDLRRLDVRRFVVSGQHYLSSAAAYCVNVQAAHHAACLPRSWVGPAGGSPTCMGVSGLV
jgi:hypothetical protein